jgi:hypothetical protein
MKNEKEKLLLFNMPMLKQLANLCNIKHYKKLRKNELVDLLIKSKKCGFIKQALDGKFSAQEQKNVLKMTKSQIVGVAKDFDVELEEWKTKPEIIKQLSATTKGAIIGSVLSGLVTIMYIKKAETADDKKKLILMAPFATALNTLAVAYIGKMIGMKSE